MDGQRSRAAQGALVPDALEVGQQAATAFEVGQLVEMTGLQQATHLNGKKGRIIAPTADTPAERFRVQLPDQEVHLVKPSNLKLVVTVLDRKTMKEFVLNFGPFLFRETEDTALVEAIRKWFEETKRKVVGEAEARTSVSHQKKQLAQRSRSTGMNKPYNMTWLVMLEAQEMVDMTDRFLQLDASLRDWETRMRDILQNNVVAVKAAAQSAYDNTLCALMESKEESLDSQECSAWDELCGNIEEVSEEECRMDCLVVNTLKDYHKYADEGDEDAFPSDMLANEAVFRGEGGAEAFTIKARFPGQTRVVVNWRKRELSLDHITFTPAQEYVICTTRDSTEPLTALLGSKRQRYTVRFETIANAACTLNLNAAPGPATGTPGPGLKGVQVLTLTLTAAPGCVTQDTHSSANHSSRARKRAATPASLQTVPLSLTISVPVEEGARRVGPMRNRLVVQALVQEIANKNAQSPLPARGCSGPAQREPAVVQEPPAGEEEEEEEDGEEEEEDEDGSDWEMRREAEPFKCYTSSEDERSAYTDSEGSMDQED